MSVLVMLAGPPGVGKTTITKLLQPHFQTYIEDYDENQHLIGLREGRTDFDAFANQRWFLDQYSAFLSNLDPNRSVILDQDPRAVIEVYGRLLSEDGRLTSSDSLALTEMFEHVRACMSRWPTSRAVFLDASSHTLSQRLGRRWGPSIMTDKWLDLVRRYFTELKRSTPNSIVIDTERSNPREIAERVRAFVNSRENSM